MGGLFSEVGLIAIALILLYIIKKINDYSYYRKTIQAEDVKVYKAARAFAQGVTFDEIRNTLNCCIDFDEEDVEEILSLSSFHRNDEDGGYSAFINAVNQVLGENVYQVSGY